MPSRITQYRCVALGVTIDGHGVQNITYSMFDADAWAHAISKHYNCTVRIYVSREFTLKNVKPTYVPKPVEKPPEKIHCLICGEINCTRSGHAEYKGRIQE